MPSRILMLIGLVAFICLAGCSTAPKTESDRSRLVADADRALQRFRTTDPGIDQRLNEAYGYTVFPQIGKGGALVGGAYGRGIVYEQGKAVGYADITQGSVGFQLGGQAFSELILLDHQAFLRFKSGEFSLGAQASAVAATAGSSAKARFQNGVIVFTIGEAGLMYEASVGGQKFSYQPM